MNRHRDDALERDLAEERARVAKTIDEIQHRLSPGQLIDEVMRHGRGAGSDVVSGLARTLSANPVPTALIGLGLLWLLLAPKDEPPRQQNETSSQANWQI